LLVRECPVTPIEYLSRIGRHGVQLAVPLAVLIGGCATLLAAWNHNVEVPQTTRLSLAMIPAPLATLGVTATTMTSAGILAIVALHMLAH
jgi:hypothetical protein